MESFGMKRKHNYQNYNRPPNRPKHNLVPGLRGFLCTCNFREKDCVRESYNLLNEYSDSNKDEAGKVQSESDNAEAGSEEGLDIQEQLSKELESLKSDKNRMPSEKRFQVVDSGAKNCIFIRTTVEEPVKLAHNILKDLEATKKPKTRFLIRLLPIEATCKAFMEDIKKAADELFEKHFTAEGKTFSIVFNCRNNNSIKRDMVIDELANLIAAKHPANRVDLKQPELAVLVEIIRSMCCISVLPDYYKLRKYNLLEVSGATEVKDTQKPSGDEKDSADPKKGEVSGTNEGEVSQRTTDDVNDTADPNEDKTDSFDGTAESCTEQSEPLKKKTGNNDDAT